MRRTVLVGKIGPAFRDKEDTHGMGAVTSWGYVQQHYSFSTFDKHDTRSRVLDVLFDATWGMLQDVERAVRRDFENDEIYWQPEGDFSAALQVL